MTEFRAEHRRFVFDLAALSVFALLVVGAVFLLGPVVLLIGALWAAVGAAMGFLIGPLFEEEE